MFRVLMIMINGTTGGMETVIKLQVCKTGSLK